MIAALPLLAALSACGSGGQKQPQMPPAQVGVVTISEQPVTTTTELTGRTSPVATAEVRPQIDGLIEARLFNEGSYVRAGQPLYQIDPRRTRASRDQAVAQLANAQAAAAALQARYDRYKRLQDADAVARQDVDDVVASLGQARANIRQYQANLSSANVNLGFTRVVAPISGRIGRSTFTKGALVSAAQSAPLATISQLDPIFVDIQQSSAALLNLRESLAGGGALPASTAVSLTLENGRVYPIQGTVEFGEVTVDESTGTVTLRARFPNPQNLLLAGMFVRVKVPQTVIPNGIVAPQQGITRDAKGNATALLVDSQNKVVQREVVVGQAIGNKWLVTSGLKAGDRLIVEGTDKARPGATVKPVPVKPDN